MCEILVRVSQKDGIKQRKTPVLRRDYGLISHTKEPDKTAAAL